MAKRPEVEVNAYNPHDVADMVQNLRKLADRVERGEVYLISFSYYSPFEEVESSTDDNKSYRFKGVTVFRAAYANTPELAQDYRDKLNDLEDQAEEEWAKLFSDDPRNIDATVSGGPDTNG